MRKKIIAAVLAVAVLASDLTVQTFAKEEEKTLYTELPDTARKWGTQD